MSKESPGIRHHARVFIRSALEEDREQFCALRSRSGRFLTQWEPLPTSKPLDVSAEDVAFQRFFDLDGGRRVPMLLFRSEGECLLGAININEIARGAFQNCALGWWIGREHAGQGYMREGLRAALEHVFLDLKLHRAEANIQPNNTPSLKLAKHLGMRQEGFSERYLKIDGTWCDHERWAITAEAWQKHQDTNY